MRVAARAIAMALVAGLAATACGPRPLPPPPAVDRIAIIGTEGGPSGARLVAIDEHGDRQLELVEPAASAVRDSNPAVSPDGRWLVFASTRGRSLHETSLWIAPLGAAKPPRRLIDGSDIDAQAVWTPDGRALVFASNRGGAGFHVWRLAMQGGQPGELVQLTRGAGNEVTPTTAPDGAIIYDAVTEDPDHPAERRDHLEERASDGTIRALTRGPRDATPAVSPDGRRVVFSRPAVHGDRADADLWLLDRATGVIAPLIELPFTDEAGPVWSRDGRFVFATSVVRVSERRVVFSSIIHVDTREAAPVARILADRVGGILRLTPALTATPLDAAALHGDPEYEAELARIMARMIQQQTESGADAPPDAAPKAPSPPEGHGSH